MIIDPQSPKTQTLIGNRTGSSFESAFLKLCKKEHRLYSNAELKELPRPFAYNRHIDDWHGKNFILQKFLRYIKKYSGKRVRILDIGCGNGWFAAALAQIPHTEVVGIDRCDYFISQAKQVFALPNLSFKTEDLFDHSLPGEHFDMILLNGVITFFPNLTKALNICSSLLADEGEIHIFESTIHNYKQVNRSKEDREAYLKELKCEEMLDHYYFHTRDALELYDHDYMYRPSVLKRIGPKKKSQYPWIRIKE